VSEAVNRVWAVVAVNLVLGLLAIAAFLLMLQDSTFTLLGLPSYLALPIIAMLAVVFSFLVPFPSGLDQGNGGPSLTDMAHRLRSKGFRVAETPKSITVHFNRWVGIDLRYQRRGKGSRLIYRLDAPASTMAIILFMFLAFFFTSVLVIPLCIFLLIQADNRTRRLVLPILSSEPSMANNSMNEIKNLLVESLSECRRLVEIAYRGVHSAYEDYILISILGIGVIGWMVIVVIIIQLPLFDPSYRVIASGVAALAASAITCSAAILLITKRMKPRVVALHKWTFRLDRAISGELSEQMPEGAESSIELLFSAYDEMPSWLNARRKSILDRHPLPYILAVMLALWGGISIFSSAFGLMVRGDTTFSLLAMVMGIALVAGALWLWRWIMKREIAEEKRLAQEWAKRREQLRGMLGLQLEENIDA
jgi:hypothetical protein